MISTHISCDHNTYHIRFRDTWLQREKEATRPFTFQPKALEMFENQYKSELLIRSHPRGRGFESLQVHQEKLWNFIFHSFFATFWENLCGCEPSVSGEFWYIWGNSPPNGSHPCYGRGDIMNEKQMHRDATLEQLAKTVASLQSFNYDTIG